MCDDFLYHHNVLTHHFLFYHYRKFLKMNGSTIHFDLKDYSLDDMPGRIIGILAAMIEQTA
ncbi:MAG: hypothetical protein ACTFAK_06830 [Candidatus Electronema sp. VV]